MNRIVIAILVLFILTAACVGSGGDDGTSRRTEAKVHFTSGFVGTCDYVTYEPGFVVCHWGTTISTSYPSSDVDHVENKLVE